MTDAPRLDPAGDEKPVITKDVGKDVEGEVEAHVRSFEGTLVGRVAWAVGIAIALYHIWVNTLGAFDQVWLTAIHFAGFAFLCALRYPLIRTRSPGATRTVLAFDIVFGLVVAVATLWLISNQNAIYDRGVKLSQLDYALSFIVIGGAIELTRRATGLIIPVLIVIALTYVVWWGPEAPGVFRFAGLSLETLLFRSIFSDEGMFGSIALISATFVFLFILFGAFLVRSGAGEFIIDLARAVAGRFVGGPGFVAVMSSGLTGTISGSAVANTVSTGVITIPLMKGEGFPLKFAAGVEAAASTGGQLMPPIMGAAAFIIAEYCGLDYLEVVIAAALPAVISYLALIYITHLEACKLGLQGLPRSEVPAFWPTLLRGLPYLLPLGLLLALLMVWRLSAQLSVFYAICCLWLVMLLWRSWRGWRAGRPAYELKRTLLEFGESLVQGGRNMMGIAVAVAAAGIIVGVVTMGLGGKVVELISFLSGGSLILVLLLTALASLILGMGLPTTANYVVMATLTVPVIVTLGAEHGMVVPVLAAHLFCFYFGILADDTPPVGLAAYAASAISGADPIKTGIQGFTYDLRTAILPFMFIFNHELLLMGVDSFWHGAWVALTALAAMLAFAAATQRWLLMRTAWWELLLLLAVALLLLRPGLLEAYGWPRWGPAVLGLALYAALIGQQGYRARIRGSRPAVSAAQACAASSSRE
jgi:TRAP transporter 4TM/12TM fusion protein